MKFLLEIDFNVLSSRIFTFSHLPSIIYIVTYIDLQSLLMDVSEYLNFIAKFKI